MKNFTKHIIGAAFSAALAVIFFIKALSYSQTAARLPKLLIVGILILSVFMTIEGYYKDKKLKKINMNNINDESSINYKQVFIFALLIAIYIFTIDLIGYFIMTPAFIVVSYAYLKSLRIRTGLIISIGFTLFVYLLFVRFLRLPIPLGFM